ncbi:MAG: tRNA 2-thiouridine(34) synthase MnmA [Magnetococcales bacterium]|nr:tRNA 2-thiouridine(34) synthase MnmA [Magnetococcales bacterium]
MPTTFREEYALDPTVSQRVAVAMSGGVDSSVVAAWLVDRGFEVVGLTMRLWAGAETSATVATSGRSCCGGDEVDDARRVAQTLGIPFYTVDLQKQFSHGVVAPFLDAYANGQTPNPCIACNEILKFRHLLDQAGSIGAAFLATGHYAVLKFPLDQPPQLFRGHDPRKDQSYFLATTPLTVLSRIRFPLGTLSKEETRRLARKWGLHLAEKRESQDVCFVPDGDYGSFFRRQGLPDRPGPIRGLDGALLGRHQGVHGYTIGQRRGLGISARHPLFVVAIDAENNELIVGPEAALYAATASVRRINWLVDPIHASRSVQVKIRYSATPVPARLEPGSQSDSVLVHFQQPQRAITPGQACVFHDGSRVLGGGWIDASVHR